MVKLAFRVDGGQNVGMGHVMRSMALASAFPENVDITFIIKEDRDVIKLLTEAGYDLIVLEKNLDYKKEIDRVKDLIVSSHFEILIVDSYRVGQDYLIELKKVINKLVSIHDFAPFAFPSDIVINGNIYARELEYKSNTNSTKFLLGTDYTLMRKEFQDLPEQLVKKQVQRIIVTVGGSDPLNLTPKILKALNRSVNFFKDSDYVSKNNFQINVIIGPAFDNINQIVKTVKRSQLETALYYNIKKMSSLMLESDLAISAGGSTLYELAVTATPTICLLQAENQRLNAQIMDKENIVLNLGPGDQVKMEDLINNIIYLIKNYQLRLKMGKKGQKIINGNGARKCVEEILK